MASLLRKVKAGIVHNGELYATIVVCGFLLVLKILHIIEREWIDSGILATLLLLAAATLRDRSHDFDVKQRIDQLSDRIGGDPGVRWYAHRRDATNDMFADLKRFSYLNFLGISHSSLVKYLRDTLAAANVALPWRAIEVCFASDFLGQAYEGNSFRRNIALARQDLAFLLTDPAYRHLLSHLQTIRLIQYEGLVSHTGSLFGDTPVHPSVIYAVHSSAHIHGDTHKALTVRFETLATGSIIHQVRITHYAEIYDRLSQNAHSLGTYGPTIWDDSAEEWERYSSQSSLLKSSMEKVVHIACVRDDDRILDLAAGTGCTSNVILTKRVQSLVLLDASPQMVRLAHDRFQRNDTVRVALCRLPSTSHEEIDLDDNRFSLIVIHQALSDLTRAFGSVDRLAAWCKSRTEVGGRLVLAADNMTVETDTPVGFHGWTDHFRVDLMRQLRSHPEFAPHLRSGRRVRLSGKEIVDAFAGQGFTLKRHSKEELPIDHYERQHMWHVPAVLDSIIDYHRVDAAALRDIVDNVMAPLLNRPSMPRTMLYWYFEWQTTPSA